jgi:hypothetical protein
MSGDPTPGATGHPRPEEDDRSSQGRRLPPPAFPSVGGKGLPRSSHRVAPQQLGDAYISPDDPVPPRPEPVEIEDIDPEEVVVTGIGDDAHLDRLELLPGGDPFVLEVLETLEKLAEAIRRKGKAGLHVTPGMTRFEATLRAYCVGYMAGRAGDQED